MRIVIIIKLIFQKVIFNSEFTFRCDEGNEYNRKIEKCEKYIHIGGKVKSLFQNCKNNSECENNLICTNSSICE